MRLSVVLISMGGVALVAAAGVTLLVSTGTLPTGRTIEAAAALHMPARHRTVAALGRIEPRSETINMGGSSTDVLVDLSVVRGSVVHKGEVLGHFRGFDEAVAREHVATQQLAEARAQRQAEAGLGQARVGAAEVQLDGVSAVDPARITAQAATIHSIEGDLANNIDILNSREALFQTQAGSRRLLADQQTLVAHERADLEAARARLTELTQQYALDRASATATLAVERATALRAQAQLPVASLEQQIALDHAQALSSSLISPIDGTVLNVIEHPGEAVGAGPILQLGDTSVMVAVAEVYETDVPQVRLGQRARVSSPALAQPLDGTVFEIGHMVYKNDVLNVDPAAKTDARVVEVRVALDGGAVVAGLTNMTVDVAIDVSRSADATPPDPARPDSTRPDPAAQSAIDPGSPDSGGMRAAR